MDILLVGRERLLLQSRRLILETYFEVKCAGRISEAASLLAEHKFEVVVLCDSLNDAERVQVIGLAQKQEPLPEILAILAPRHDGNALAGVRTVDLTDGPLLLVRECAFVLGRFRQKGKVPHSATCATARGILKDVSIA